MKSRMKPCFTFLLTLIVLSILNGCSKEKKIIVENEWRVESIKVHVDSALQYPNSNSTYYNLSFENKKIDLSRKYYLFTGHCSGKVIFKPGNKVKFKTPDCMKICCGGLAEVIRANITSFNRYEVTSERLTFQGENGTILTLTK